MAWARRSQRSAWWQDRLVIVRLLMTVFAAALVGRLFIVQITQHSFYTALAQDQHQLSQQLLPARGQILVHDSQSSGGTYPLATNRTLHLLYAVPKQITQPVEIAHQLAPFVTLPEEDIIKRLSKANDLYEPIQHYVKDEVMAKIENLKITGLYFSEENTRYYPEKNVGSHLLGFVGFDGDEKAGRYGLEGALNDELAGHKGYIQAEKDAGGQLIASAASFWQPAINGTDVVLTIDRAVQFEACKQLDAAVQKHGADGGSVIIMDPKTGAIIAMCGAPDYDPNEYNKVEDVKTFLNPATQLTYEPGSVFKALTMAAALNEGKVRPETTYTDTGEIKVGSFTIKNSDGKAHGVQSMTQVLQESLNTGAIFAMQQIGADVFSKYIRNFGFGTATNVGVDESVGNLQSLQTGKDIYAMTGSFGQGLSVTPLQLASAYAALASGGKLMQPYVIDRVKKPDGTTIVTEPKMVRQVISSQASVTVSAMLVNVVRNGHGKRAGVPGYYVAGKTGTAQIPDPKAGGYLKDLTIGTFAGYAPVEDPKFVMVTKLDKPRDVQFAESSAAPLFGSLAKFLLSYYHVAPTDTVAPQP